MIRRANITLQNHAGIIFINFILGIENTLLVLYNTHTREYTVVECLPPIPKERRFGDNE